MDKFETKAFRFEIKTVDEEAGTFEGYASVFGNKDSDGEVIDRGAFKKTLKEQAMFPLYWMHEWSGNSAAIPIGGFAGTEDSHGLKIAGSLNMDDPRVRDQIYPLMKKGVVTGISVGFKTIKDMYEANVRHIKELKLAESSLTPAGWAANSLATVTAVKSDAPDSEPSMLESALEVKVSDLVETLAQEVQQEKMRESRWKIEGALYTVISNLFEDKDMAVEDKLAVLSTSLDQYKMLMITWFASAMNIVAASDSPESMTKTTTALLETRQPGLTTEVVEPQIEAVKSLRHLMSTMKTDLSRRLN